jgi:septal ring factor EnvC (AmiA/AmiB activator)
MEEKLRQKESSIEKLKLKNSTLKVLISKHEQQLAQKEEMGEVREELSTGG